MATFLKGHNDTLFLGRRESCKDTGLLGKIAQLLFAEVDQLIASDDFTGLQMDILADLAGNKRIKMQPRFMVR